MWSENFQIYKLGFKEAEEPEIKLPTFIGSWRKQGNYRKNIYFCFIDYTKTLTAWITTNWEILKQMGIPDHLTCLLRNLYVGQDATVRTRHEMTDWFKIGKRVWQGCIWSPCLFKLYPEYIIWNAGLDESQAGMKIPGRNVNNLRYPDDTTLIAESDEELKSLLMRVNENSEKAC